MAFPPAQSSSCPRPTAATAQLPSSCPELPPAAAWPLQRAVNETASLGCQSSTRLSASLVLLRLMLAGSGGGPRVPATAGQAGRLGPAEGRWRKISGQDLRIMPDDAVAVCQSQQGLCLQVQPCAERAAPLCSLLAWPAWSLQLPSAALRECLHAPADHRAHPGRFGRHRQQACALARC